MQNSTDVLFSLGTDILPFSCIFISPNLFFKLIGLQNSIGQSYCFLLELLNWLIMKIKLPDIG